MTVKLEEGERVVLVHLHLKNPVKPSDIQEFRHLAISAGAQVVGEISANRHTPDAEFFIGSGKVQELRELVSSLQAELVLFDCSLSPAQERNLERAIQCRVVDRTGLILDIFAARARTYEGKLQVELAEVKHQASRLIRGWTHLERQKGGIGLRGGPGEKQLEVDRRLLRDRVKHIQARLEKVRQQRDQSRRARKKAALPTVSLVGYTNAGKSTLFNHLTGSSVLVADQLFATLDPTLRILELPSLGKVILADTVGFIRQLPHTLIEAFRATLEETRDSDLLLHVIDSQDDLRDEHIEQVEKILAEIGALAVPCIQVYNKIDLSPNPVQCLQRDVNGVVERVFVSAANGLGIEFLKEAIVNRLGKELIYKKICLMPEQSKQRALLYEMGVVEAETYDEAGTSQLQIRIRQSQWEYLCSVDPIFEAINRVKLAKNQE